MIAFREKGEKVGIQRVAENRSNFLLGWGMYHHFNDASVVVLSPAIWPWFTGSGSLVPHQAPMMVVASFSSLDFLTIF